MSCILPREQNLSYKKSQEIVELLEKGVGGGERREGKSQ